MRAKSKQAKDFERLALFNKIKEGIIAKKHCQANSFFDGRKKEMIYLGFPEDTVAAVNIEFGVDTVPELIPETPHCVVLEDSRGEGLFQ